MYMIRNALEKKRCIVEGKVDATQKAASIDR